MSLTSFITKARRKIGRTIGGFKHEEEFFTWLIAHTGNFSNTTWLGEPLWQNTLDLWIIQETISQVKPSLLIETGTNRGGSSRFFAHLFDLMNHGKIITIDVETLHQLSHPRITYLIGNSTGDVILNQVRTAVAQTEGPIMVILDSDHSQAHVRAELESYSPFVSKGSYLLVQDGVIDTLPLFKRYRPSEGGPPGPLPAIHDFIRSHPEFEIDQERCSKFMITHHPSGWLRRKS